MDNIVHRFDIVVLWSYMLYRVHYYDDFLKYFTPFIKLVLGDKLVVVNTDKSVDNSKKCEQGIFFEFVSDISKYKDKLPQALQGFVNGIDTQEFCREVNDIPRFVNNLKKYKKRLYDIIERLDMPDHTMGHEITSFSAVLSLFSSMNKFANKELYKILDDLGVVDNIKNIDIKSNKSYTIMLFEAAMLNWIVSERPLSDLIRNRLDSHIDSNDMVHRGLVDKINQGLKDKKYMDYQVDIVKLWASFTIIRDHKMYKQRFEDFVKLVLGEVD